MKAGQNFVSVLISFDAKHLQLCAFCELFIIKFLIHKFIAITKEQGKCPCFIIRAYFFGPETACHTPV